MVANNTFDYKKEFWKLFKNFATFLLGSEAYINSLPRQDLVKVLEELVEEYEKRIKENRDTATGGAAWGIMLGQNALSIMHRLLEQAKSGKKILTVK